MLDAGTIEWHKNQICLNSIPEEPDNYKLGVGSLIFDWDKMEREVKNDMHTISAPRSQRKLHDRDFTVLCSQFKGTRFEQIYNEIASRYKIGRARLMMNLPHNCLSWHVDATPRIHYPLKTQEGCLMVIEDEVLHMPADTWWYADTTLKHTAMNASNEYRIHLVAAIL